MPKPITIQSVINAPIAKVWDYWNNPLHIPGWAFAADDWEASDVENDLRVGGKFKTVMSAKDKSASFDFTGTYNAVNKNELIEYVMSDGRRVKVTFKEAPGGVEVTEIFDPENENPEEVQREGWQAILNNFKKYAENGGKARI